MQPAALKILVILLLVAGEALSIYAELIGAHQYSLHQGSFWPVFFRMFLVIALAGAFLVAGFTLGYGAFKNIWIVSVLSLTSILVTEPLISYAIFHELPTRGAWFGLAFGLMGCVSAMFL